MNVLRMISEKKSAIRESIGKYYDKKNIKLVNELEEVNKLRDKRVMHAMLRDDISASKKESFKSSRLGRTIKGLKEGASNIKKEIKSFKDEGLTSEKSSLSKKKSKKNSKKLSKKDVIPNPWRTTTREDNPWRIK